jgi:hypothetical protein
MDSGTLGFIAIILLLLLILRPGPPRWNPALRRTPLWAHEAAGTKVARPAMATVLTVGVLIWIGAQLAVKYFADDPTPPRPVQNPACAEAARLAAHGVTDGASYTRARDACNRAGR